MDSRLPTLRPAHLTTAYRREQRAPITAADAFADHVVSLALQDLVADLIAFNAGEVPAEGQVDPLRRQLRSMTALAQRRYEQRIAYATECGMGKTRATISWLAVNHRLGLPFTAVVLAEKVAELAVLRYELEKKGIPPELIGFQHSKTVDELLEIRRDFTIPESVDLRSTRTPSRFPILLACHENFRQHGRDLLAVDLPGRPRDRDLAVYDEALRISSQRVLDAHRLAQALAVFESERRHASNWTRAQNDAVIATSRVLRDFVELLDAEIAAQCSGSAPKVLETVALTSEESAEMRKALGAIMRTKASLAQKSKLESVLKMLGDPVRLVVDGRGSAAVTFDLKVPDEFSRVVVLDGNYNITALSSVPGSRLVGAEYTPFKRYDLLELRRMVLPDGRSGLEKRQNLEKVAGELAHLLRNVIPSDEFAVVWVPKFRPRLGDALDIPGTLKRLLETEYDVNPEATLPLVRGGEVTQAPRIVWRTLGTETADNSLGHTQNAVLLALPYLPRAVAAGQYVGEAADYLVELDQGHITDVVVTEAAGGVFQAIHRGIIRQLRPAPMRVWISCGSATGRRIVDHLVRFLPGVQELPWESVGSPPGQPGPRERATEHVRRVLEELQPGQSISKAEVWRGFGPLSKTLRAEVVAEAIAELGYTASAHRIRRPSP